MVHHKRLSIGIDCFTALFRVEPVVALLDKREQICYGDKSSIRTQGVSVGETLPC